MSLQITFIAPFGLRAKTTVWARTLPIAQQLVARGHSATILIPPWDSPQDQGKKETLGGVPMHQVSLAGGPLATTRRLLDAAAHTKPHVVHIVKPRAYAGLVQWWLWQRRSNASAKLVLDVDDWEQSWNPINRYGWAMEKFLTWQEEWGIRHADGITAASRWLESKVASVAPAMPTLYLPNGVERIDTTAADPAQPDAPPDASPDASPDSKPRILLFTRFVEVTPKWLKEFWAEMLRLVPDAEFVVAGTPVQHWLAEPFHNALARAPQVKWKGYVSTEKLAELYAATTCAIFPAMPIPLLQAKCSVRLATTLLHGVPVVASAVGEHTSYGADGTATLVHADATPQQFARAVANLLSNRAEQSATRTHATERLLTRYAWSQLVEPLPAFYESLL